MKMITLVFFVLFYSVPSFSQYIHEDTNQPDSVYRVNKVKSRTMRHLNDRVAIIYNYNLDGKITEVLHLFNNSRVMSRVVFNYDNTGKLITEKEEIFVKVDSTTTKYALDSASIFESMRPVIINVFYNELGKIDKKISLNSNGIKIEEVLFTYDPLKKTQKIFNLRNHTCDSMITEYEMPDIASSYIGYRIDGSQLLFIAGSKMSNYFDKYGKLIRRVIINNMTKGLVKKAVELYKYNNRGLLAKKQETKYYENEKKTATLIVDYTYW